MRFEFLCHAPKSVFFLTLKNNLTLNFSFHLSEQRLCEMSFVSVVGFCIGRYGFMRTATVSFLMAVRPSVRMQQVGSHWTDFYENFYLRILLTFLENVQIPPKSDKNNGTVNEYLCTFMTVPR
jgi:hypothetical protein